MALFNRVGKPRAVHDAQGDVRVVIRLTSKGQERRRKGSDFVKDNITRSFTIGDAKVSEVSRAIVEFLFEDGDMC